MAIITSTEKNGTMQIWEASVNNDKQAGMVTCQVAQMCENVFFADLWTHESHAWKNSKTRLKGP